MTKERAIECVSIALTILIVAMPSVSALTTMPAAGDTTTVYQDSSCGKDGYAPVDTQSYHLNSNPDTVRVPYDIRWRDFRSSPSYPRATHYFFLQTEYLGSYQSTDKTVYTYGGTSGSDTLTLDVLNVAKNQYVNITYAASVSGPTGDRCPAQGSWTGHYYFVYP